MAERIAWGALLRLGLGRLGLTPDEFWGLTPAELVAMAGAGGATGRGMRRAALDALAARFPDGGESENGGT
jgi:uncharacterized phage protein (TIGR02216 family)